jgi:hypothetical protein
MKKTLFSALAILTLLNQTLKIKFILIPILWMSFFLAFQNCAPVFSELQTAKTVGKGNVELSPNGTIVFEDGFGHIQDEIGAQLIYGLSDKVDLRLRYVYVAGGKTHAHVFGVAPKISLRKDKIALNLLVGTGYDSELNQFLDFNFHPSLLFTSTITENKIDLTLAPKLLIIVRDGIYPAINFNSSLSSNLQKYSIRPEVGLLYADGIFVQASLSFSLVLGRP